MGLAEDYRAAWLAGFDAEMARVTPEGYKMTITLQRWIPVAERLPEDDSECLTVDADGIRRVARFDAIGDRERPSWYAQADFRTVYPVAWMPLPEPPEAK